MRWAGLVECMGRGEVYKGFRWGNLRERDYLEDQIVDGKIILRWTFRKWDVGAWAGSRWLRTGQAAGTCECGKEPSDFMKCWEFPEYLRTGLLLKKDSAPLQYASSHHPNAKVTNRSHVFASKTKHRQHACLTYGSSRPVP